MVKRSGSSARMISTASPYLPSTWNGFHWVIHWYSGRRTSPPSLTWSNGLALMSWESCLGGSLLATSPAEPPPPEVHAVTASATATARAVARPRRRAVVEASMRVPLVRSVERELGRSRHDLA